MDVPLRDGAVNAQPQAHSGAKAAYDAAPPLLGAQMSLPTRRVRAATSGATREP
jgi:hypothetical protein